MQQRPGFPNNPNNQHYPNNPNNQQHPNNPNNPNIPNNPNNQHYPNNPNNQQYPNNPNNSSNQYYPNNPNNPNSQYYPNNPSNQGNPNAPYYPNNPNSQYRPNNPNNQSNPTPPYYSNSSNNQSNPNNQKNKRLLIVVTSVVLICLIAGLGIWKIYGTRQASPTASKPHVTVTPSVQPTATALPKGSVSPLLFGTNVSFFDQNDQVLTSANARTLLQQIHPTIIRMPTRQSTLTLDLEVQMAKTIQSLGAAPVIILQGPNTTNPMDYNTRLIQAMNGVFGTSTTVYYEFSNEEDLAHHTSAQDYVSAWNSMVPALKKLAPTAHFVGPVISGYNQDYLMTFLQQANPKPDEVSWHEYTCDKGDDPNLCLTKIDNWTKHITNARAAMQSSLGKVYPIMITEWNYAANADPNDGKDGNAQFMTDWTTKAFETLAANRIYASMQYSATNSNMPLIDANNASTPQGTVFRNEYQKMIVKQQQPASIATPSP